MKQVFFFFLIFCIGTSVFAQKKLKVEKAPKDMYFCPQGSYVTEIDNNHGYFGKYTVSIQAFWISSEITNKQFREFWEYVIKNPEDSLFWVDLSLAAEKFKRFSFDTDTLNTERKKFDRSSFVKSVKCSEIKDEIIHFNIWNTDEENIQQVVYFTDPKFDDYPVLGVTYEGARLYCIWRTQTENKINEEKGLPLVQDYRLPTEYEWEYASKNMIERTEKIYEGLHPVKTDKKKKYGLNSMGDNVAEWTAGLKEKDGTKKVVVRGGSHNTEWTCGKREYTDPEHSSNDIGFRIVRTYIGFIGDY